MPIFTLNPPITFRDLRQVPMTFSTLTLDATTTKIAVICRAAKTGSLDNLSIYVSGGSNLQNLRVSIQTVGPNATPSGTDWATNTNATITPLGGWATATLTADAAVTEGDQFAVVIEWATTAGNIVFSTNTSHGVAMTSTYAASTWTPAASTWPAMAIGYADGSFPPRMALPLRANSIVDVSTTGATKEAGWKWSCDQAYRLRGAYFYGYLRDSALTLYNTSNVVLATGVLPSGYPTDAVDRWTFVPLSYQLAAATQYRLVVTPNSATTSRFYNYATPNLGNEALGLPTDARHTARGTIGGSWTDAANLANSIFPVFDGVSVATGFSWNGGLNG